VADRQTGGRAIAC